MNYNKVMLMGNLTRDPEVKYLPSGTAVVEFTLAVNRSWTDKQSGEKKEQVAFIDCKAMGRPAEVILQYVGMGRPLFVEGRLDYRQWEQNGQKRSKLEVFVEQFQFVGGRDGGERSSPDQKDRAAAIDDDVPF